MGKGSSSQETKNTYNNYNLQGTEADNVVVGSNNTVTDHGAVKGALNFAGEAVNANQVVSLASMEHVSDIAEKATNTVGDAWRDSSKLVASVSNDAAQMVADESAANIDRISHINANTSDRIERMANAVATGGQNLIARNNVKNLYIIGGVSALSVVAMAVMAARSKQ